MSEDNFNIEEMFREALQHHETPVRAELWTSIESSIGNAGAAGSTASTGSAFLAKAAAVIGFSGLITAATISEVKHWPSNEKHEAEVAKEQIKPNRAELNEEPTLVLSEEDLALQEQEETIAEEQQSAISEEPEIAISEPKAKAVSADKSTPTSGDKKGDKAKSTATGNTVTANETSVEPTMAKQNNEAQSPKEEVAEKTADVEPESQEQKEEQLKTTAYFSREIPNIFTPNGDGFNDLFYIEGNGFKSFEISIMNRVGAVVFESSSIDFRWDGKDRFGNNISDGIYFYEIRAYGMDDLPYLEENSKGTITLKR